MIEKFKSKIKVAGRAIEYWGSQSISSDASALFELIKNSRDADATKVEVIFENVSSLGGTITIKDNGNGMTKTEVDEKWMIAGTDSKIVNTVSRGGRRRGNNNSRQEDCKQNSRTAGTGICLADQHIQTAAIHQRKNRNKPRGNPVSGQTKQLQGVKMLCV